jgi:hypothetical protein
MSKKVKRSVKTKVTKSTFTYFIPAPPHRKTGYREKEFDKILSGILQSGFELESLHTQSVSSDTDNGGSGMFVVAVLKAPNQKISKLDWDQNIQEQFKLNHSHSSPDIILEENDDQ